MSRFLASLVVLGLLGLQSAQAGFRVDTPELMQQVVSSDPAVRTKVIEELRAAGPDAMRPLFELRDHLQMLRDAARQAGKDDSLAVEQLARAEGVIDEVAAQRYACHSRLYWFTDLEAAKAVAVKEKKPILSLRMLGKLNEDFSCANSRFFRTTLYANEDISKLLRERFVLHWKSVRPVPKVTIDFGDGRKLERTLTGNSIHYVLTPEGDIVDALPGLYGPAAFLQHLQDVLPVCATVQQLEGQARVNNLTAYHQSAISKLDQRWADDYQSAAQALGLPVSRAVGPDELKNTLTAAQPAQQVQLPPAAEPPAGKAVRVAVPKMRIERRLVNAAVPSDPVAVTDERLWEAIAQLHAKEAQLDAASLSLIRSQNPTAIRAGGVTRGKRDVEDPLLRMVRSLQGSIAIDTVRNEYQLHRQIHQWLAAADHAEVEQFNEQVYAQLFLTPSSDPWLGLAPADAYSALPNGGVATK
ncbi:hypothetical protein [Anatilimnocola floriformis]|uniref:hypothetical protein n=1 Tax=Anatilimnocola floriformis TaxID=2948575 RepID=UPI0020C3EB71|nr:hypothetical protein [Anatilimnocola floriformis]